MNYFDLEGLPMQDAPVGYEAFRVYSGLKHLHFKQIKWNILEDELPHRIEKQWNEKRYKTDGPLFHAIESKFSTRKQLIDVMTPYIMKDQNFHVSSILDDNFLQYRNYLKTFDTETLTTEFMTIAHEVHQKKINEQDLLFGQKPHLLKLYQRKSISFNTLKYFHKYTNFLKDDVEYASQFDTNKINRTKFLLAKYELLVYDRLEWSKWHRAVTVIQSACKGV
jgi:hypothetical protein